MLPTRAQTCLPIEIFQHPHVWPFRRADTILDLSEFTLLSSKTSVDMDERTASSHGPSAQSPNIVLDVCTLNHVRVRRGGKANAQCLRAVITTS